MNKIGGAVAFALALGLSAPTIAVAESTPDMTQTPAAATAPDKGRGEKCVTRQEYKRIKVRGSRRHRSTIREVRRIMDFKGKRVSLVHSGGHRWERRKYRHCGSVVLHVYVNYRDRWAYAKFGKPDRRPHGRTR